MRNGDGTREQIVAAAGRVFAQYGVDKTTVTDIVREARVARGTFYKLFSDKEQIFRAVLAAETHEMLERVRGAAAGGGDTRARLEGALLTYTSLVRERLNLYRVTVESLVQIMPVEAWHVEMRNFIQGFRELYREILEDGVKAGEIAVEDPGRTAWVLLIVFRGIFMASLTGDIAEDREAVVKTVVGMVVDGLRPREAGA